MSLVVEGPTPFIFVHLPRTGGRSVAEALISVVHDSYIRKFPTLISKLKIARTKPHPYHGILHSGFDHLELLTLEKSRENYYKFSIVRNPWDIAISYYFYSFPQSDFDEQLFIEAVVPHLKKIGYFDKLCLDGKVALDYIIRFENLISDFETFCKKINILPPPLPHLGKEKRKRDYRSYYGSSSRRAIERVFKKYNQTFNYEF